jgi:hypothetical protein
MSRTMTYIRDQRLMMFDLRIVGASNRWHDAVQGSQQAAASRICVPKVEQVMCMGKLRHLR